MRKLIATLYRLEILNGEDKERFHWNLERVVYSLVETLDNLNITCPDTERDEYFCENQLKNKMLGTWA